MHKIANAAPDHASCDACGEPNRTGDSVVYVGKSWCKRRRLEWFDGLKLCIWCRVTMVQGGSYTRSPAKIRRQVENAKKWHKRKKALKEKLSELYTQLHPNK